MLAGPGSGKTRVITRRIARLIEHGVAAHDILAMTFTNKAAREMAERVDQLVPGTQVRVSTFHRFCARLLRQHGEAVGLGSNYTILDQSEQVQLLRRLLKDEDVCVHFGLCAERCPTAAWVMQLFGLQITYAGETPVLSLP